MAKERMKIALILLIAGGIFMCAEAKGRAGAPRTPSVGHNDLAQARKAKKDEFYTQRVDIENEVKYYRDHFRGKTVLCNCDDPRESWFWKFWPFSNFSGKGFFVGGLERRELLAAG